MDFVDTHSHIYSEEFSNDIEQVIVRAKQNNLVKIFLPTTEYESVAPMLSLYERDRNLFVPMVGLYPGSVTKDVDKQLAQIKPYLNNKSVVGIGEIGFDFYWDRNFVDEQLTAFLTQMRWSKDNNDMPVSIHCRKAFDEIFSCFKQLNYSSYKGVFHCFGGDIYQAHKVIEMGFLLGIGGVVTFKNAHLTDIVRNIDLSHLVLETDSPYLTPVPYRGKRNESAYIPLIAQKISQIKEISLEQVAEQTTKNAFGLLKK